MNIAEKNHAIKTTWVRMQETAKKQGALDVLAMAYSRKMLSQDEVIELMRHIAKDDSELADMLLQDAQEVA